MRIRPLMYIYCTFINGMQDSISSLYTWQDQIASKTTEYANKSAQILHSWVFPSVAGQGRR